MGSRLFLMVMQNEDEPSQGVEVVTTCFAETAEEATRKMLYPPGDQRVILTVDTSELGVLDGVCEPADLAARLLEQLDQSETDRAGFTEGEMTVMSLGTLFSMVWNAGRNYERQQSGTKKQ